jgi:hypothetical protein
LHEALPALQRFMGERLTQDLLVEEGAAYYVAPSADDDTLHAESVFEGVA